MMMTFSIDHTFTQYTKWANERKKKKNHPKIHTKKKKKFNWQYMMFKKWNKSNNYYGFACVIQNWYTTMLGNLTWFIVHIYIYTHIIYLFKEAT